MIKADLRRQARLFQSRADYDAFLRLYMQRLKDPTLKVPVGLDRYFVLSQEPEERRIAPLARQFYDDELLRTKALITALESELRELATVKTTAASRKKIESREKKRVKLTARLDFSFDRITPIDERIYPGYFAPVIQEKGGERLLVPMRYRVRRPDGGEVPYQYNVFNARRDSLLTAATWKPLFARSHAIFPFVKFFEWVEREGKKREISFVPQDRSMMWAASLFSQPKGGGYLSFAMVTDDPPPEVAAAGHDRCPVFLANDHLDGWLSPAGKTKEELLALLDYKEKTFYLHDLVA